MGTLNFNQPVPTVWPAITNIQINIYEQSTLLYRFQ